MLSLRVFKKYEKWIMLGILLVTALAFGITGTMLDVFSGGKKENLAGEVFGKPITKVEFNNCHGRWTAWTDWMLINFQKYPFYLTYMAPYNMIDFELLKSNREKYLDEVAWNAIILSRLADKSGISVSENEVSEYIKSSPRLTDQSRNFSMEEYRSLLINLRIPADEFERTGAEFLKIAKYYNLVSSAVTASAEDSFKDYISKNDEIKMHWVTFKPDDFISKIKAGSAEEIREYYERNAPKYEIPLKVRMEYIFTAVDELKNKAAEPNQKEIDNYFNEHKAAEYKDKTLDQVKDEVKSIITSRNANDLALELISNAEKKIVQLSVQDKPVSLEDLASEFKLKYAQTGWFATDRISEIEKELGSSPFLKRQLGTFQEKDISDSIKTDKGYLIFRLTGKKGSYLPKLTAQLEEKVSYNLRKEKAAASAEGSAKRLLQSINAQINDATQKALSQTGAASLENSAVINIKKEAFTNLTDGIFGVKSSDFFKVNGPLQMETQASNQFLEEVFKLQEGGINVMPDKSSDGKDIVYHLVQVTNRRPGTPSSFYARQKELTNNATMEKREKFMTEWKSKVKTEAKLVTYKQ
ncbi:MAG: SurA N-terminal domain-containing protein [Planctomycetota bacterium]